MKTSIVITKRLKNIVSLPKPTHVILKDLDGNEFRATAQQADAVKSLIVSRAGGVASVRGYKPAAGYVIGRGPTVDLQIITRFSTENLYKRRMSALSEIRYSDVADLIKKDILLDSMSHANLLALFNTRKADEVESMNKTISGDRSDSHRQAHDRCYAKMAKGIKLHYVTEKIAGIMEPVLTDGLPTAASIMVSYLQISKTVRVEGEYRIINSGAAVRMSNCIVQLLNSKSVGFRMLSLKEDNFESLVMDRKTYLPSDTSSIPLDVLD